MADQRGNQGQGQGMSGRRNPADNLSHEDRVRGGERSAQMQQRDEQGQFAGRNKGAGDTRNRQGRQAGR